MTAESLSLTFAELPGADEADVLEITLGTAEAPVEIAPLKEPDVIWGTTRRALNEYAASLTERNGRRIIRVELKPTRE